jgi:crossover junction endodeoxyribonuclease RuvC
MGIDPGLERVGFGIIDIGPDGTVAHCDWGVITTPKHKPESARLQEIHHDLTEVLQEWKPAIVSVERLFFFRNVTTAMSVAQARGVILLALNQAGIPMSEYTPMQVKQAMTGYGKSEKKEIQQMVAQLLGLDAVPKPDDAADALAMALCHWQHNRFLPEADAV